MVLSQYTSPNQPNATPKPDNGGVRVVATSRGKTLQAYNFTQKRFVGVGSVSGATYEKGNCVILRVVRGEYDPSFALTVAELQAARDLGATFLRCITPDKITYSISLNDFEKLARPYSNGYYGEQLAVSVDHFAKTGNSKKRNAILDNPRQGSGPSYERPQPKQLGMFGDAPRFDNLGNYRR